jgi:hypothetical protein
MNTRLRILNSFIICKGQFAIRHLPFIVLFALIVLNSCIKLGNPDISDPTADAGGNVFDFFSQEKIGNAEVQILGWYASWFYPGTYYSTPIDTCYTDASGHFSIKFKSTYKDGYSVRVSKERYFSEETMRTSSEAMKIVNVGIFPHGYIKTHITNKITAARWLEISFSSYLSPSVPFWREGYINTWVLSRAFKDTTIVTTTIGGLNNKLQILMTPTESSLDNVTVKDTSFTTISHDTIRLTITLN